MTYVVYADVLWLVNFAVDFCLLAATAFFGSFAAHWRRLLLAAALGALYGIGLLWPQLAWAYVVPLPIIASLVMLRLAFGRLTFRRFGALTAYFYLLATAFAGLVLGFRTLWGESWFGFSASWLLPAFLAAGAVAFAGIRGFRHNLRQCGLLGEVVIKSGGKEVLLPCFLDTGNRLREPVSGRPVLLVELAAVQDILPKELYEKLHRLYLGGGLRSRPYQIMAECGDYPWAAKMVLVPYSSVGEVGSLLMGWQADCVAFCVGGPGKMMPGVQPVLALSPFSLRGLKGARAIVHPDCLWGKWPQPALEAVIDEGFLGRVEDVLESVS